MDYSGTYLFIGDNVKKLFILSKIENGYKLYKIINDIKKDRNHLESKELLQSDNNFKNEIDTIVKNFIKL